MTQVVGDNLLHGEEVDLSAKPHPLSFIKYHLFAVYLVGLAVFLAWLYSLLRSGDVFPGLLGFLRFIFGGFGMEPAEAVLLILFWVILLVSGFAVGSLWVSKMPLVYLILVGAAGTALEIYVPPPYGLLLVQKPVVKLVVLGAAGAVGTLLTEAYRRGHCYVLTNYRVIMKKSFIGKEERELTYDKITDVYVNQGILGRIFNFGTVIPISASGLGLGEDTAQAFAAAAVSVRNGAAGGGFGGGKSVRRPRDATYFSLYGIPDPRRVRVIIGNRQLETEETPILKRIEGLLKDKETKEQRLD